MTLRTLRRLGSLQPEHERWMYEGLMRRDAELFYEAGSAAVRFDSRAWVGRLGIPITVVIADRDPIVPSAAQRELAELIPDATVVELEGVGHESIFNRAADYVSLIDEAISKDG